MIWIMVLVLIIVILGLIWVLLRKNITRAYRPFLNVYAVDNNRNVILTNIIFLTQPFSQYEHVDTYEKYKKEGNVFLGMTSYSEFPGMISNPHDRFNNTDDMAWNYNYGEIVDGWCYCFREPEKYIKDNKPRLMLSESDFANYDMLSPKPNVKPVYDFIYICIKDNDSCTPGWQSYNRNWEKAKEMLKIMCEKFGLKGLLVGRLNCEIPLGCHQLMDLTDFQDYLTFIQNYNKVKFIFVPNITDASPRVVTEAMCFNLPVFMNSAIIGGWKYVTPETGAFFNNDMTDFEQSLKIFLSKLDTYTPREYFIKNYGKYNSGKRLLEFIKKVYPKDKLNFDIDTIEYIKPGV